MRAASSRLVVEQDDAEFLAAAAAHDIDLAQARAEQIGQRSQDIVAGPVAVDVVHLFEVVEVDHGQADLRAGAPASLHFVGQPAP